MKRILITGASGLLGINCALRYQGRYFVTGVVCKTPLRNPPFQQVVADLCIESEIFRVFSVGKPDAVIHCAALTNVDFCEKNPERAFRINTTMTEMLAREAWRRGVQFLYVSTDAVFDGARGNYNEEDKPNPLSVYAQSKLQAESRAQECHPQSVVARINLYGWSLSGDRSLGEFFFNKLESGQEMVGFFDVFFSPLEATQIADILLRLLERKASGLFHVASSESQSKYQFGVNVARRFGFNERLIRPISVLESGLAARRSPNLSLCTNKLQTFLGKAPPTQAEALDRFYELLCAGYPQRLRAFKNAR